MLQTGTVLETAIWMTGDEPDGVKDRFVRDLRGGLASMASAEGVIIGPLVMTELKPGDDRMPKVPDYIHGSDVRLLVGEAVVFGPEFQSEGYFVADLEPKDLARLRAIARKAFKKLNPDKPELSIERCDEFINQNGPDIALEALRETVH